MLSRKGLLLILVAVLIVAAIALLELSKAGPSSLQKNMLNLLGTKSDKADQFEPAREIVSPSGFVNTEPGFQLADIIGKKVILVDFWTYSCINCQRTLPYLNAWYEKYKDQGLEIVGIHTPEFDFEKKIENVRDAVEKYGIKYPVVLDNDYATWQAYGNRYWPRKYLVDIDGYIVYDHIGEGAYDETEKKIQELLRERADRLQDQTANQISSDVTSPADATDVDVTELMSPETYFGAQRNQFLGNGLPGLVGAQSFTEPSDIKPNTLYLVGDWNITEEYAENVSAGAKIIFRYQAKDAHLVAGTEGKVRLRVRLDGRAPGSLAGADVGDPNGEATVEVEAEDLYKLIHDSSGYGEHIIEITIDQPGLQAFTFTFG